MLRAAKRAPPPTRRPWRRRWRRARRAAGERALRLFGPSLLRALVGSWRVSVVEADARRAAEERGGAILALWHGRMLLGLPVSRDEGVVVLVSASDDGSLAREVLATFGYGVVRGSTSWGGSSAMREMLDGLLEHRRVLVITPDGPRGPRHSIGPGLVWMARATGRAVVPEGLACDRAWRLRSWDRFTVPWPRARVVCAYAAPVSVAADADEEQLEAATALLCERMRAAEERAFAELGLEPDP